MTGYARLDLAKVEPARLALGQINDQAPFAETGNEALIVKENRLPNAEVRLSAGCIFSAAARVITVELKPGESYDLEILHEDPRNEVPIPVSASGDYWLGTVSSGPVVD